MSHFNSASTCSSTKWCRAYNVVSIVVVFVSIDGSLLRLGEGLFQKKNAVMASLRKALSVYAICVCVWRLIRAGKGQIMSIYSLTSSVDRMLLNE